MGWTEWPRLAQSGRANEEKGKKLVCQSVLRTGLGLPEPGRENNAPLRRLTNKILTEKAEEASESVTPLRAPLGFSGVRVLPSPQANKESEELQKISLIVLREQRGTWQELLSSSLTVLSPAGG